MKLFASRSPAEGPSSYAPLIKAAQAAGYTEAMIDALNVVKAETTGSATVRIATELTRLATVRRDK